MEAMNPLNLEKLAELSVVLAHRRPVIPMVRTYRGKGGLHLALELARRHCACYTTLHNARKKKIRWLYIAWSTPPFFKWTATGLRSPAKVETS